MNQLTSIPATITLRSCDGADFVVPQSVAYMSELVKIMAEDGDLTEALPLMDVRAVTLRKVLAFCTRHVNPEYPVPDIEKPIVADDIAVIVSDWDAQFINDQVETNLYELILVANYMDIEPLVELGCAKIATMMNDKSTTEIREMFDLKDDFTADEYQQMKQLKWVEQL